MILGKSAEQVLNKAANKFGWNRETMLRVTLEYLDCNHDILNHIGNNHISFSKFLNLVGLEEIRVK